MNIYINIKNITQNNIYLENYSLHINILIKQISVKVTEKLFEYKIYLQALTLFEQLNVLILFFFLISSLFFIWNQKQVNAGPENSAPGNGGSGSDPKGSDDPKGPDDDPKKLGWLAILYATLNSNKGLLIGIGVCTIVAAVAVGGYFIFKHYNIDPPSIEIPSSEAITQASDSLPHSPAEVISNSNLGITTQVSHVLNRENSVMDFVYSNPSSSNTSYIPPYFLNLQMTPALFVPDSEIISYEEYKLKIFLNFYDLYEGLNPQKVCVDDIIGSELLTGEDYNKIFKHYTPEFQENFKELLIQVAKGAVSEEQIVAYMPKYFDILRQFLYLIQERKLS